MKRLLPPVLLACVLFTGWTIQHLGAAHAVERAEARAANSEDFQSDAAQRSKLGLPRHWSAMILQK